MRFLILLLLIAFTPLFGEEAQQATGDQLPTWLQAVIGVAVTVITTVLVPLLKRWADKVKSEENASLLGQLKEEALTMASNIAEKSLPEIATMVKEGKLKSKSEVKIALRALGNSAKEELKETFKDRGVDLVKKYGERGIDQAIRWAADKVSPFPGKDTAEALLSEGADKLLELGVTKLQKKYLEE